MTKSVTCPEAQKHSSCPQMGDSETYEKVIRLGKKLVATLGELKEDEISVWMANYIAEQIVTAEQVSSQEAKKNCFEAILKLWGHQSNYPQSARPFVHINSILTAIDSLNPDSEVPRYMVNHELENESLPEEVRQLVTVAIGLDDSAKTLITYFFDMALKMATTEQDREWFDAISGIKKSEEKTVIDEFEQVISGAGAANHPKTLEDRIAKLKAFEDWSKALRGELELQLKQSNSDK